MAQMPRLCTANEDQLGLGHPGGRIANDARVIAAVAQLQGVDAQNAGEGIDLQDLDVPTAHWRFVDHPAHGQRQVAGRHCAGERQPFAQPQRRIHLKRCDFRRHCSPTAMTSVKCLFLSFFSLSPSCLIGSTRIVFPSVHATTFL